MPLLRKDGTISWGVPREIKPRPDLIVPLEVVRRTTIESALILCEGNRTMAARALGISQEMLFKYIREFRRQDQAA